MSDNQVVQIFKYLIEGISRHGVVKVLSYLKLMNIEYDEGDKKNLIDFIITKVCLRYKVSVEDLMFTKKRGAVTDAKKMCVCLLCNYLEREQVKSILSVTYQLVYLYDTDSPMKKGAVSNSDIEFIKTYEELKEMADSFKNSIGLESLNLCIENER